MEFLYQDMLSASGRYLAHSEKGTQAGRTTYLLQLIDRSSDTVVHQQAFHDWQAYSRQHDVVRTTVLPFR
jgi:hypothetical protein